jgi:pyroglutamyl-peptidase
MISNKILFTGFEPFGKWKVNPTEVAVKHLDGFAYNDFTIIGRVIPLHYNEISNHLKELVNKLKPSAIVLSVQAGGSSIRLDKRAKNYVNTKTPYNCGTNIEDEKLIANGPDEYYTS